jgi:hypothetical protein
VVVVGVVVGEVVDGAGAVVDGGADVGGPALSDSGIDGGGGTCDGGGGASMTPDTSALDGGADGGTRPVEDGGGAGAPVVAVGVVSGRGLEALSVRPVSAVTLANPSTKARTPAAAIANLRVGDVPSFSALGVSVLESGAIGFSRGKASRTVAGETGTLAAFRNPAAPKRRKDQRPTARSS